MRRWALGLAVGAIAATFWLMTPSVRAQKTLGRKKQPTSAQPAWVEQTLRKMTLREKLGQMLMPYYFGAFTPTDSAEFKDLLHEVKENHVGGFILGTERGPLGIERSQVYPTAVLTNELQRRAKIPLMIGADFESGTGMRLDEGTSYPSAMALAATGDPKVAYAVGKSIAIEARAAGVQWIFAPDADVNNNPDNPIINVRSFGEDPASVANFVTEFVRGVEENGGLATAKHFPGHGNVSVDSHLALAVVSGDRSELDSTELVPFRAAIGANVGSIMPGHLSVPAIEADPNLPATLSPKILTGLLREQMNFSGLVVTDAMDMGGVTSLYPPGEAAVRAVEAGDDVLLMPPLPDAAMAGLEQAVKSGRISEKRIDASVRKILTAKARLGLNRNRMVDVAQISSVFAQPSREAEAQAIADRGVTLLRDKSNLLPLDAAKPLRVLLVALSADPDPVPGETIEPELRPRVDSLTVLRADTQYKSVKSLNLPAPENYDVAIAALFVRVADRKGNVGFPDEQRTLVDQLIKGGKPVVVASFGSPYLIERFPDAPTWVAEFSTNDVSQRAVARAIFGQTSIGGIIPVSVPGTVNRGDGLRVPANPMTLKPASAEISAQLKPAYALLDQAVADGAFPGGVLGVGLNGQLAVHPFGKVSASPKAAAVTPETIYDVASLTKSIVTTTAVMMLAQRKEIDLDAPVGLYLPAFAAAAKNHPDAAWRPRVTVRMLLLHDAGLSAHEDFYKKAKGKEAMLAAVMAEPLVRAPGTQIEYSDLGFILLGEIVERLTGTTLDDFAQREIFARLGMNSSLFNPPKRLRPQIAPTEIDETYRKRLVQGEVDDENAYAMGGVAGHAGLFSTTDDVATFAQMLLNGGVYAHHRFLALSAINTFTRRTAVGDSARALGWDVPVEPSSSGHHFSAKSFGHTGFTGTSLWIDPERKLFVVLLTNRVNPTRANDKIRQVRPALHDAVIAALGLADGRQSN
jgi:beta-glucosidase-like glycosyl hydrolase/CubicO group peptidase (beta-lactamase class C family)